LDDATLSGVGDVIFHRGDEVFVLVNHLIHVHAIERCSAATTTIASITTSSIRLIINPVSRDS
jgi:hypothetical protein